MTVLPCRDRVRFMVRFARVTPRSKGLDVGFRLPRRLDHPRFHRVETIVANAHVHSVRLARRDEFCEAYTVGCRRRAS